MENKYYVPKVQEFFEEFCFDQLIGTSTTGNKIWVKSVFFLEDNTKNDIKELLNKGKVRVKFLDKEDIESLGWKVKVYNNGSGYFNFKNYNFGFHDSTNEKSSIFMRCTISQNDFGNNIMIFQGTIKNKSELKRLMQQLNILVDGKS